MATQPTQTSGTGPKATTGTIAGVIGMLGSLATLQILNWLTDVRPLAESLADGILLLLPVDLFGTMKEALGDQAKTWLLIGILIGFLLLGAGLGRWIAASSLWRPRIFQASGVLFVLAVTLLFLIDRNQLRDDFTLTVTTLVIAVVVFGLVVYALLQPVTTVDSGTRRQAIGTMVVGIGAILLGRNVWNLWQRQANTVAAQPEGAATSAITPNNEFYRISKNFVDPDATSGASWSMEIGGIVDQPGAWNLEQLQALGAKHSISTMLCISNEVGGNLIGTAEWTGVPLSLLLDEIGAAGNFVHFTGKDDYETTVPLDRCRHEQAFLVWGMNGEPLPADHGAPVRAIIPGLYGMKSVKWITAIEAIDDDRLGYWEQRNWTNIATVKPMSRIDFPRRNSNLNEGNVQIRGIAFGGDAGLSAVDISTDGGDSWQEARITEQPNPDGIAWSLWQYDWDAKGGTHQIIARMIATDGTVQTDDKASPLPDGSSGWHRVDVFINRT